MCQLGKVVIAIILILVLIGLFYFTVNYDYLVVKPKRKDVDKILEDEGKKNCSDKCLDKCKLKNSGQETPPVVNLGKENKSTMSIMSNYSNGVIESRVINLIPYRGNFYVYSNKDAYHVHQLEVDNRVSIMSYIKDGYVYKQILLYGVLDRIDEIDGLVLYKMSVEHRKISLTYENGPIQTTTQSYDGKDGIELKTDLVSVGNIIKYIKSL